MIEREIPQQRQASLHDILATTAEESRNRAEIAINAAQRREAHFMRELLFVTSVLATKWGVDPEKIQTQQPFETKVIYYRKLVPQTQISTPQEIIHQRKPIDEPSTSEISPPIQTREEIPLDHKEKPLPDEVTVYENAAITQIDQSGQVSQISLINGMISEAERLQKMQSVGRAVSLLLVQNGVTQQMLADHLGLSKSTIDKSVRGQRVLKPGVLLDICDFLGLPEADDRREVLIKMALAEDRTKRKLSQSTKQKTTKNL